MKPRVISILLLAVSVAAATGWFLKRPAVSGKARAASIYALKDRLGSVPAKGTLIIVDFSRASRTRRLAAVDLGTGETLFYARVAHGKNSGGVYASELSNAIGSLKSSAGLFEVGDSFKGKHGASFRLRGLDPRLNGNAEERGIIIHSAGYVSLMSIIANWREGFRLGRSEGCFVLSVGDFKRLEKELVRPAYLYSYGEES
jgi:L,D-transpeptidase-like protein